MAQALTSASERPLDRQEGGMVHAALGAEPPEVVWEFIGFPPQPNVAETLLLKSTPHGNECVVVL